MQPRITYLEEKKLVGKKLKMSFANNSTGELWGSFMPRRKEINNQVSTALFSLQVYDKAQFENFDPAREFEKWALTEVTDFGNVPHGLEKFALAGGQYAVFIHKGSSTDDRTFQYIYGHWLPNSDYLLDDRPHFEILGDKYKNNDLNSEEEIWIPIRPKS
jgi:AraC family transcriptional regulator